jgi:tRNA A-37 threonylcarbamoyl transferase component Bud32
MIATFGAELVGRTLLNGEYTLTQLLQSGGSATVYRAHSRSLDIDVAVKVLAPRLSSDPVLRERFQEEAHRLAALHHPNLLEVYFFGEEDELVYIAMRLVQPGSLRDYVRKRGPVDLVSAARLIGQLGGALQLVHDEHLVHLDVKPANVLLGRADWPLLADLGIATLMSGANGTPGTRQLAGTPSYMAPEHWRGGPVDGRTDEYALAVTAYELLTGRLPFVGNTTEDLRQQHIETPPPRPRELAPAVPGPVEAVVLRGMAKAPEDRFPRASDFAQAFSDAAERARGMALQTKSSLAEATPNLLSALALIVLGPLLLGILPAGAMLGPLPVALPFQLLIAAAIAGLVIGVRWHVIGLAARALASIADSVNSLGRTLAPSATPEAAAWRNKLVSAAEGLVDLVLLMGVYRLVGVPLVALVGIFIEPSLGRYVALGLALIVAILALRIVIIIVRSSGAAVAGGAIAFAWILANALPTDALALEDTSGFGWSVRLVVGGGIMALLVLRRATIRRYLGRVAAAATEGLASSDGQESQRAYVERLAAGVVDVLLLLLGTQLVGAPIAAGLQRVLDPLAATIVVTGAAGVIWILLVVRLYRASGAMGVVLGIVLGAPLLLSVPALAEQAFTSSMPATVATWIIGVALVIALAFVRRPVQRVGQRALGARLDRGLLGTSSAATEESAVQRAGVLGRLASAAIDIALLIAAYWVVATHAGPALAEATGVPWVGTLLLGMLVLAALARLLMPARRAAATLSDSSAAWSGRAGVFAGAALALTAVTAAGFGATPVAFVAPAAVGLEPVTVASTELAPRNPREGRIALGVPVSGVINQSGSTMRYALSARAGQTMYFQTRSGSGTSSDLTWRLVDSTGQSVFDTCLACGDPGVKMLVRGGAYTLTIGKEGVPATGAYQFWVWDVPPPKQAATSIGATVSERIASPGVHHVYTFTATAGQSVFFQFKPGSGVTTVDARLTDPVDRQVFRACLCSDPGVKTLQRPGTYTLTIGSDREAATGTYQFWLWDVPPPKVMPSAFDTAIADAVPSPGAKNVYTFSANAGQVVYVQVKPGTGASDLKIRLTDSLDQVVVDTCLGCGDPGVKTLARGGEYRLTLGNDSSPATGPYQAWLWRVPPIKRATLVLGTPVSDTIPSPGAKHVYGFSATAGQTVVVEPRGQTVGGIKWRVIDPLQQPVGDSCFGCGNSNPLTLTRDGTYTVEVGADTSPDAGPYELTLAPR